MTSRTTVPLYDGDDFERMAELRREVEIAERQVAAAQVNAESGAPARLGDDTESVAKAKDRLEEKRATFTAFVDEASERAEMWVLEAIGHEEFRQLLKDHPPRMIKVTDDDGKEHEVIHGEDAMWKVNTETYPKALLTFVDPEDDEIRTVAAPFESVQALRKRIRRLSEGEFASMWIAAHALNRGMAADPKASPYYGITATSSGT